MKIGAKVIKKLNTNKLNYKIMKKVYLIDVRRENGRFETYKCAFKSKEAAKKIAKLFRVENRVYEVCLVGLNDI